MDACGWGRPARVLGLVSLPGYDRNAVEQRQREGSIRCSRLWWGAPINITDGFHCWAAYLEWDITSGSLSNWAPVPGQGTFEQVYDSGANKGDQVKNTTATTLISAWSVFGFGAAVNNGKTADQGQYQEQGWFGTHGMYAHQATSGTTVYGLRLVLTGLLHPAHASGQSPYENLLLYDINASGTLTYKGGRLTAVQMRGD